LCGRWGGTVALETWRQVFVPDMPGVFAPLGPAADKKKRKR
jgi:hypothetical protein